MLTSLFASVLVVPHQAQPTLAYLDPGTGSLLLQASLAAVLSVPFILRSRIASVLSRMHGGRNHAAAPVDAHGNRRP